MESQKYEYGCVMLYFNFPTMKILHRAIKPEDLYTEEGSRSFGLEREPHVTLLYGLHDGVEVSEVEELVQTYPFSRCRLYNASLFENEYDVLKFNVEGINLYTCNKLLKGLPHTNNFPDYRPHTTIAYLKKGKGAQYIEMLEHLEFEIMPTHVIYSEANGQKHNLKIDLV